MIRADLIASCAGGIVFTAADIRSSRDGRKTRTTRVIPPGDVAYYASKAGGMEPMVPHYKPGKRYYVKESFCWERDPITCRLTNQFFYQLDDHDVMALDDDGGQRYRADGSEASPWISPIRMPRKAARFAVEIVAATPMRLQDITEDSAIDEGAIRMPMPELGDSVEMWKLGDDILSDTPVEAYARAWDALHGKKAPWSSNPWVWSYSYKWLDTPPELPAAGAEVGP